MTLWTDKLHVEIEPAGRSLLRGLLALAAVVALLGLPGAFETPTPFGGASIASARVDDGRGGWRDADLSALTLRRGGVTRLEAVVRIDPAQAASGEPLGLYLSGTFSAQAVWNGVPVGAKGSPGATPATEAPGPVDVVLALPAETVRGGDNRLSLTLSSERLRHPVRTVIHGSGRVFGLRVAPYSAEARRPIGHYAAPFAMSGVLLLGLAALALRRDGAADRWGALILGGLAAAALTEVSRSVINYPYPWHALRMTVLTAAVLAAGLGMVLRAEHLAPTQAPPAVRWLLAAIVPVAAIFLPLGDGRILAVSGLVGAAIAGAAALRGRPQALEFATALALVAAFAILDPADFMDRSLYAAAAPLAALLVWRPRPATSAAPRRPTPARIAVGPSGSQRYVAASAIRAIHGAGDYAELRLASGERLLHAETLQALAERLPDGFFRAHRSHIVNLAHVDALRALGGGRHQVRLSDGDWLPVARARAPALRRALKAG